MLLEKISKLDKVSLQQNFNRIPLLKHRYRGSFPSDFVPTPNNATFAITNAQPSFMQSNHWMKIANSGQIMFFADSLGRKKDSLLKQQNEQMIPEPIQSHTRISGFYTSTWYMQLYLFKFRQEEEILS